MITTSCQRWRDRRERRVPAGPLIDAADYAVDLIPERRARPFVVQHHYSGSFPAARECAGLFRRAELVGVAVFSVPMNNRAVPAWTGLPEPNAGAELGRFVLLDEVPGNAESWFLRRALAALAAERRDIKGLLSYSDPVERRVLGRLVKPGHVGTIYQALSAPYRGKTGRRTGYMTADGAVVSGRSLSKIRLGERGAGYAVEQLAELGARQIPGESGAAFVERLVRERWLRRFSHPGNHVYLFPLTRGARAVASRLETFDYPKLGRAA
jgi:hypothetical protein